VTSTVANLLSRHGPSLSSELAINLTNDGVSPAAARKRIERAGPPVRKLAYVKFPHNERFIFLDEQFKTDRFWRAILAAFQKRESAYGLAINALLARDGVIPEKLFSTISGSPVRMKGQISSEAVVRGLLNTELISRTPHPEWGSVLSTSTPLLLPGQSLHPGLSRARLIAEDLLLIGLREWVRRLGLASFNKVKLRNAAKDQPGFGQFTWDLTAPSYLPPISRAINGRVTPGFITADVLLHRDVSEDQLKPFVRKVRVMRSQPKTSPFLAMFVADRFERGAFELAKKNGVMPATVENIFGQEIASALNEMVVALSNAAAIATGNPDTLHKLFSKLEAIKGADLNVKGALFELVVARTLAVSGFSIQGMNYPVTNSEYGMAEIDVFGVLKGDIRVVECKGYLRNRVTLVQARDWVTKRIPTIVDHLRSQKVYRDKDISIEYWSVSGFELDASEYLNTVSQRTKKYSISFRDASGIESEIEETGDVYLTGVFKQHYRDYLMR
jgi:hypothetical protein